MKKETQISFVIKRLVARKSISRNWALKFYITRLAAIIATLKQRGCLITGKKVAVQKGQQYDYLYTISKFPKTMLGGESNG